MNWQHIPVRDWRLIHQNVVWLVAAMLFAGLLLLFSQGLLHYNQSQLQPMQIKLTELRTAADAAEAALQAAKENKQRYLELEQRGVIGSAEHRLDWVEQLTSHKRSDPELKLQYAIAPQRPLEQSEPSGSSGLLASQMKLQYAALHEGQFSRIHQSLKRVPGWSAPLGCELARTTDSTRLEVICSYEWLSIAPAPTGQEPPQ